jgi:predicted nucleotide-binding protein
MYERLTAAAQAVLAEARRMARADKHHEVSTGHLLLSLASAANSATAVILAELGAGPEHVNRRLQARLPAEPRPGIPDPPYSDGLSQILQAAGRGSGPDAVTPEHLLLALAGSHEATATLILHDLKVPATQIHARIKALQEWGTFSSGKARNVFVVHGRDGEARSAMFDFLRSLDLLPWEWEQVVRNSEVVAPYIGDALLRVFDHIQATVVVLTPDDIASLHRDFHEGRDSPSELGPSGQSRQNVLFEAGMATMRMPDRTILVEIGYTRPFTDIEGRSVVRIGVDTADTVDKVKRIVERLRSAGCAVDDSGTDWLNVTRFTQLKAHSRVAHKV